jgi:hypothetical protein
MEMSSSDPLPALAAARVPPASSLRRTPGGKLRSLLEQQTNPAQRTLVSLASPVGEAVVAPGTDWVELDRLVTELGLTERLGFYSERLVAAGVPDAWVKRWSRAQQARAMANLSLVEEEARLLELFRNAGIEALQVKGVSLARILCGDPGARLVTDTDLCLRREQVARAGAILEECGYRTRMPRALLEKEAFLRGGDEHSSEAVYARDTAGGELLVELHWNALSLPEQTLWSSALDYPAGAGPAVHSLSPELYFAYLCGHAAGHRCGSLRWLCDVADFVERFSGRMNVPLLRRHCVAAGLRRRVRVVLTLLDAYFGLWWAPAGEWGDARDDFLAEALLLRPLLPELEPNLSATHRERLALLDNRWERVRYVARLMQPTHVEWQDKQGRVRSRPMAWTIRAGRLARLVLAGAERRRPDA